METESRRFYCADIHDERASAVDLRKPFHAFVGRSFCDVWAVFSLENGTGFMDDDGMP